MTLAVALALPLLAVAALVIAGVAVPTVILYGCMAALIVVAFASK